MKNKILFCIFIFILTAILFSACGTTSQAANLSILISGDVIAPGKAELKEKVTFDAEDNGETVKTEGYKLSALLKEKSVIAEENYVLLTGADQISAKVEYSDADLIYLVAQDGKINVKAPSHPRAAGIKNLAEITVVAKTAVSAGIMLLTPEKDTEYLSMGNARLKFFTVGAENKFNGKVAYKYLPTPDKVFLNALTGENVNLVYLKNGDIKKSLNNGEIVWENGTLLFNNGSEKKEIRGVLGGVEKTVFDTFSDMKTALDADKRVMVFLTDGYSLLQAKQFNSGLKMLSDKNSYVTAASVFPAVSNVALASIITGGTPYETDITVRGMKKPALPDIFNYALSLNKKAAYIEGNGNLIVTDLKPILNPADTEGSTDFNVYSCAKAEIEKNPDLLFVHFHGIDDMNHAYSPESAEAEQKIKEIDGYIYELTKNFIGTVIIVSDHGSQTLSGGESKKGAHGEYFSIGDMLIPYYIIEKTE